VAWLRSQVDSTIYFAIQKVQLTAEAFRDAALMVEENFPVIFDDMSLMFKTEPVVMTCFLHKNVKHWLENWQRNFHLYDADVKNCAYLFYESIYPTLEIGVEAAFARCFKDDNGTICMKGDDDWERLKTKLKPSDLSRRFIDNIHSEYYRLQKWQMHQDTLQRDAHLKEFHQDFRIGAEGEHYHIR
jgi:Fe-S cluster biosynthesis and repair protein YggX